MRKFLLILFVSSCFLAAAQKKEIIKDQYLLVIDNDFYTPMLERADAKSITDRRQRATYFKKHNKRFRKKLLNPLARVGIKPSDVLAVSSGYKNYALLKLTPAVRKKIEKWNSINQFFQNYREQLNLPNYEPPEEDLSSTQKLDWGVVEVGANNTSGEGKVAFVLDTGIELTHEDLNVDASLSASFIPTEPSACDLNGHGTHVAGIIGAKDNHLGTKGVAADATLIAVKVCDKTGHAQGASTILGADYTSAIAQPGDVVNCSFGTRNPNNLLEDVLLYALAARGIYVTLSAGNDNIEARLSSPARLNGPNIYTVSNMDSNRDITESSNYGNGPIDFAAPGHQIYSTDITANGSYSVQSGTSMAAPHVAGILLVLNGSVLTNGVVNSDKDTLPDPVASAQ